MLLIFTMLALGQLDPQQITPDQLPQLLQMLVQAFHSHDWALLCGLLLAAVVAGVRMLDLGKKIPDAAMPWMVMGMAVATSMALGLQQHMSAWKILTTGAVVGATAIGGWETLGKLARDQLMPLMKRLFSSAPPVPPAAPPAA